MIIVSQDKNMMVNFDNAESIDIVADLDGTGETPYKIHYETYSKREEIGKYKTEERAKEILQEIIELYEISRTYESKNGIIVFRDNKFIYEMPEK